MSWLIGIAVPLLVAVLPMLCFLAALVWLDSYKLVRPTWVLAAMAGGAVVAAIAYLLNGWILGASGMQLEVYARYVSPWLEELLKGALIVMLLRSHRIGFLVDAAIHGVAVGAGFALVENLYFLCLMPDAGMPTWIVRGFGTAIMHGGCTAIFALLSLLLLELKPKLGPVGFLPGFGLAVLLHSGFNHLSNDPKHATLAMFLVLPPLLMWVFHRSEQATRSWLGQGFDADLQTLELLNSGQFGESRLGRYLDGLRQTVQGTVLADMLCYARLSTELAMRAKGVLMMRENGFEVRVDEALQASLDELAYLESSIGKTGLRLLRPMLSTSHRDLARMYALGST